MTDLTGSNSTVTMTFPFTTTPINLQEFTLEESIVTNASDVSQTTFDLNGTPHYALIYNEYNITIKFLATSPSIDFFTRWKSEMFLYKMAFGTGILSVSVFSKGKRYIFNDCVLKNCSDMPVLQNILGDVTVTLACNPLCKIMDL